MNDIYARRLARTSMFHQSFRVLPTLWQATKLTHEKLDSHFLEEEFMRVQGHRTLHLLIPEMNGQKFARSHWNDLMDGCSWAQSGRAQSVRFHSPLNQRFASVGLLSESIEKFRSNATVQNLFLEQVARTEGITTYDKLRTEEFIDEDDAVVEAAGTGAEQVVNSDDGEA